MSAGVGCLLTFDARHGKLACKDHQFLRGRAAMLFGIDIDHTIATYKGTDAFDTYIRALGIPLSSSWRKDHYPQLLTPDALLRAPLYAAWYKAQASPSDDIKQL